MAAGVAKPEATRRSIRGLLCRRCNRRLLPSCRDTVVILERAIDYLQAECEPAQRLLTDSKGVQ